MSPWIVTSDSPPVAVCTWSEVAEDVPPDKLELITEETEAPATASELDADLLDDSAKLLVCAAADELGDPFGVEWCGLWGFEGGFLFVLPRPLCVG